MRIITGSHLSDTGKVNKKNEPIMETITDAVEIKGTPRLLSDFPEGTIAGKSAKPDAQGQITVVTVDGQKVKVSASGKPAAEAKP